MKSKYKFIKSCIIIACLAQASLLAQTGKSGLFSATSDLSRLKFDDIPTSYQPNYHNAIGLRGGGTSGLTFKHFFNSADAFEGILGFWPNAIGITGLYERHMGFSKAPGLKFYYGGGAHFSAATDRYYYDKHHDNWYGYHHDDFGIGIDGIVGIEYKIPVIPFAISFDLKPFVEASNDGYFYTALDPGIGIKVAF